jgi:S-adenosylmethionine:diacylglycerol 3-amino-3-carboxypropyl transferase
LPCFHVQKETGVLCKRNGNFYSIVNVGYEQPRTNNNFLIDDCENAYTYYLKKYSYQNEGILKKYCNHFAAEHHKNTISR